MKRIFLFLADQPRRRAGAVDRRPPDRRRHVAGGARPAATSACWCSRRSSASAARSSRWPCPSAWPSVSMGVRVIEQPPDPTEQWLLSVVGHHARNVGRRHAGSGHLRLAGAERLRHRRRRNAALVAVSTGLLQRMNRQEIEAVLGHEMTPRRERRHGDAHPDPGRGEHLRDLPRRASSATSSTARCSAPRTAAAPAYFMTVYRAADRVRHARRPDRHVVLALARVPRRSRRCAACRHGQHDRRARGAEAGARAAAGQQFAAFGIADGSVASGLRRLFMSHPPLDERIAALRAARQPLTAAAPEPARGQLREILGADGMLTADADCARYLTDHRRLYQGRALRRAAAAHRGRGRRGCSRCATRSASAWCPRAATPATAAARRRMNPASRWCCRSSGSTASAASMPPTTR